MYQGVNISAGGFVAIKQVKRQTIPKDQLGSIMVRSTYQPMSSRVCLCRTTRIFLSRSHSLSVESRSSHPRYRAKSICSRSSTMRTL